MGILPRELLEPPRRILHPNPTRLRATVPDLAEICGSDGQDLLDRIAVKHALAELAHHDAEALRCIEQRFLVGRSCRRGAEVLGISPATMRKRLAAGLARLRHLLGYDFMRR